MESPHNFEIQRVRRTSDLRHTAYRLERYQCELHFSTSTIASRQTRKSNHSNENASRPIVGVSSIVMPIAVTKMTKTVTFDKNNLTALPIEACFASSSICMICLDQIASTTSVFYLPYTHTAHPSCLKQWLAKCKLPRCPRCRADLDRVSAAISK